MVEDQTKAYRYETVTIGALRKSEFGWLLLKDGKYVGVMEFATPTARKAVYKVAKSISIGEDKNWLYLSPLIQVTVKYQSYTKNGLLRSPSFVGFILDDQGLPSVSGE